VIGPEAVEAASHGSSLRLDLDAGTVEVDGASFPIVPVPEFMRAMFAAGGLVPWVAERLGSA
jgi:3-isopropylmalate dehydratase small subunit